MGQGQNEVGNSAISHEPVLVLILQKQTSNHRPSVGSITSGPPETRIFEFTTLKSDLFRVIHCAGYRLLARTTKNVREMKPDGNVRETY